MVKRSKTMISIGEEVQYKGIVHGSVGIDFLLEYDKTAFKEYKELSYTDPKRAHLCGGDEQEVIYTLVSLKEGKYVIKVIDIFRGSKTVRQEDEIKVKDESIKTLEELVCNDCGNVCNSLQCNKCGSKNIEKFKLEKNHAECICYKCDYITHRCIDFRYCPICGSALQKRTCDFEDDLEIHNSHIGKETLKPINESYIIVSQYFSISFWHDTAELTSEVLSAKKIVKQLRIAKSREQQKFGIVNTKHEVLVDFLYDYIQPFRYACLPGPGPLPPINKWFIGAFFTNGSHVGYLRIFEDGHIAEYGTCTREEYEFRCKLS